MKPIAVIIIKISFFSAVLLCPLILEAQEHSDETFADYLFRNGEYYRAITEYHRELYREPDHYKRSHILRKIGLCYYRGEDYNGYISFQYLNRFNYSRDSLIQAEMTLYLGKSYYHLSHYRKVIGLLDSLQYNPKNLYYNEFQLLVAISHVRLNDWQSGIRQLQGIQPTENGLDEIKAGNMIRSFQNFSRVSNKNPVLAGGMSAIIPGSGYVYCHHWGTGIASLVVNGLLAWAFIDAVENKQYGIASLTGFVGIGWYIGNIGGSARAARRYNIKRREEFINNILLRENYLEYLKN